MQGSHSLAPLLAEEGHLLGTIFAFLLFWVLTFFFCHFDSISILMTLSLNLLFNLPFGHFYTKCTHADCIMRRVQTASTFQRRMQPKEKDQMFHFRFIFMCIYTFLSNDASASPFLQAFRNAGGHFLRVLTHETMEEFWNRFSYERIMQLLLRTRRFGRRRINY